MSRATFLALGDIHLGRRPAGLSPLLSRGFDPGLIGPKAALSRAVEEALARRVDAVLFAGDVVERANRMFEAYGALSEGVERLLEAGIQVLAVAGNHDVEVLPKLADRLDERFRLLGRNGRWEAVIVPARGDVRVVGWSFPSPHWRNSPLPVPQELMSPRLPTIGLLHGDLGVLESPYAPLARVELEAATGIDAWLLGHVHAPSIDVRSTRPIGYLGSLVGLDPTETGVHGPWLVEIGDAGVERLEHLPLAPLAWRRATIEIGSAHDAEELVGELLQCLSGHIAQAKLEDSGALALGVRLMVRGRSSQRAKIERAIRELLASGDLVVEKEGVAAFFESIDVLVRDAIDLAALAIGTSPVARVAQRIRALEADGAEGKRLVESARRRLELEAARPVWTELEPPLLDEDSVREELLAAAWTALHQLEDARVGARAQP